MAKLCTRRSFVNQDCLAVGFESEWRSPPTALGDHQTGVDVAAIHPKAVLTSVTSRMSYRGSHEPKV